MSNFTGHNIPNTAPIIISFLCSDPGTESAAVPHTALCRETERILETRETAGGGGGTGRRSAGAGPGPRLWRSFGGSWGNSTLGRKKLVS